MAIANITLDVKTKISWWVKPLIGVAGFAYALRVPVSEEWLVDFIMHHGVHMSFDCLPVKPSGQA